MSEYESISVIYKRNCSVCGRIYNTRREDKQWCNSGHCKYIFQGKPYKRVLVQVIDETTNDQQPRQEAPAPVVQPS